MVCVVRHGVLGSAIQILSFLLSPGLSLVLGELLGWNVRSPASAGLTVLPLIFLAGLAVEVHALRLLASPAVDRWLLVAVAMFLVPAVSGLVLIAASAYAPQILDYALLAFFLGNFVSAGGAVVLMSIYRAVARLTGVGRFTTSGVFLLISFILMATLALAPLGIVLGIVACALKISSYRGVARDKFITSKNP